MSDFEFNGFSVQSIEMKYLPPTNYRCGRIRAVAACGEKIIDSYDHSMTIVKNFERVALLLVKKLEWAPSKYAIGSTREGYVMTFYQ